jgi:hypothetical protein
MVNWKKTFGIALIVAGAITIFTGANVFMRIPEYHSNYNTFPLVDTTTAMKNCSASSFHVYASRHIPNWEYNIKY